MSKHLVLPCGCRINDTTVLGMCTLHAQQYAFMVKDYEKHNRRALTGMARIANLDEASRLSATGVALYFDRAQSGYPW